MDACASSRSDRRASHSSKRPPIRSAVSSVRCAQRFGDRLAFGRDGHAARRRRHGRRRSRRTRRSSRSRPRALESCSRTAACSARSAARTTRRSCRTRPRSSRTATSRPRSRRSPPFSPASEQPAGRLPVRLVNRRALPRRRGRGARGLRDTDARADRRIAKLIAGLSPEHRAGQTMAIAFHGPTITSAVEEMIRVRGVGGVVLRTENAFGPRPAREDRARTCSASPSRRRSPRLFLALDQEGGSVARVGGSPMVPSQMASRGDAGSGGVGPREPRRSPRTSCSRRA